MKTPSKTPSRMNNSSALQSYLKLYHYDGTSGVSNAFCKKNIPQIMCGVFKILKSCTVCTLGF